MYCICGHNGANAKYSNYGDETDYNEGFWRLLDEQNMG
jgi:hypothetical protein